MPSGTCPRLHRSRRQLWHASPRGWKRERRPLTPGADCVGRLSVALFCSWVPRRPRPSAWIFCPDGSSGPSRRHPSRFSHTRHPARDAPRGVQTRPPQPRSRGRAPRPKSPRLRLAESHPWWRSTARNPRAPWPLAPTRRAGAFPEKSRAREADQSRCWARRRQPRRLHLLQPRRSSLDRRLRRLQRPSSTAFSWRWSDRRSIHPRSPKPSRPRSRIPPHPLRLPGPRTPPNTSAKRFVPSVSSILQRRRWPSWINTLPSFTTPSPMSRCSCGSMPCWRWASRPKCSGCSTGCPFPTRPHREHSSSRVASCALPPTVVPRPSRISITRWQAVASPPSPRSWDAPCAKNAWATARERSSIGSVSVRNSPTIPRPKLPRNPACEALTAPVIRYFSLRYPRPICQGLPT